MGKLVWVVAVAGVALRGGPPTDPPGAEAVAIQTFQFRPKVLEIKPGTQVTWTNGDDIEHTVTAGAPDTAQQTFDHSLGAQGSTFRFTFERPGRYPYFCSRHQFMRGEVRVTGGER